MADLKAEMERLEDAIRKLKVQYELYFVGAEKLPPTKMHEDVDRQIKKLANLNFQRSADRFYFNNVQNRYNAYTELWNKQLRMREEGRQATGRVSSRRDSMPAAAARAAASQASAQRSPAGPASGQSGVRVRVEGAEDPALRTLYEQLGAARARSGQKEAMPAFDRFREQIRAQLEALRQKGVGGQVEFRVSAQDGKVSLKARPVR
jgi:hypothetical protein